MKAIRMFTYAAILSAIVAYVSCKKSDNDSPPGPDPNGTYTPEYVTASVTGRVVDDNNIPVNGAVVKAGSLSATTDLNGSFKFSNASLDKNAGFVKVEKDGFFQGSRTFTVNAGGTSYVTIQLIKKTVAGTISGSSGGNVTVPSGGSISFAANSFVNTATNAAYSGTVSVNAFFINPAAANFREIMPGSLRGINGNQIVGLKSYGMMAVELTGVSGEKLQLAQGTQASITFPIPADLQSAAPASIALWHFNDTTGLWKQEGVAAKEGTNYVAKVSHFSFWNCDDPFPVVDFKATLKDKSGTPIPGAQVVLKIAGDGNTESADGYTTEAGVVSGPVPVNKALKMTVYSNCGTLIHTQDIGPFASNTDMGVITVNTTVQPATSIIGTVVNCTGNLVANGQVNIFVNNQNYRALVTNGSFSLQISRCDNAAITAKLQAFDFATNQQGAETSLSITTSPANAGQLSACGSTINEFINYTLNGTQVVLIPPDILGGRVTSNMTAVSGYHSNQTNYTYFRFPATATGTVALDSVYIEMANGPWKKSGSGTVNVTEYGQVGEYIAGDYSGNVTNGTATAPITIRFRVKRKAQ